MRLKTGSEGCQDLRIGEEAGAGAQRKYYGFVSLLFSYPSCLGYLTLMHEL